jgi:hypothetical protein
MKYTKGGARQNDVVRVVAVGSTCFVCTKDADYNTLRSWSNQIRPSSLEVATARQGRARRSRNFSRS